MDRPLATGLKELDALLGRHREAILAHDAAALDETSRALELQIRELRACGAQAATTEALERARASLRVNAGMLTRVQAANARALATIFGAEGFYGAGGDDRLARTSRPLDSA